MQKATKAHKKEAQAKADATEQAAGDTKIKSSPDKVGEEAKRAAEGRDASPAEA